MSYIRTLMACWTLLTDFWAIVLRAFEVQEWPFSSLPLKEFRLWHPNGASGALLVPNRGPKCPLVWGRLPFPRLFRSPCVISDRCDSKPALYHLKALEFQYVTHSLALHLYIIIATLNLPYNNPTAFLEGTLYLPF